MALVGGAGLGAGLMYLLDPDRGERRRERLGEAISDASARMGAGDVMGDVMSGMRYGMQRAGTRFDAPALVSGLTGAARASRSMRPVWRDGRLALERRRRGAGALDRYRWSLLGIAAGVLAAGVWGLWRREPGEVHESIMVNAPPERVWETWTRFENFPRFMPAVREVRAMGGDRTHWVVTGPAGTPIEFEATVTRRDPPNALAWRTVEGALVSHGGSVRFRPSGGGATRIDVTMWWRPAAGAVGEGVATLSSLDPAHLLREGLKRFKMEVERAAPATTEPGTPGGRR
jgi:uncharacterized membrane protein